MDARLVLTRLLAPRAFAIRAGMPIERIVIRRDISRATYAN